MPRKSYRRSDYDDYDYDDRYYEYLESRREWEDEICDCRDDEDLCRYCRSGHTFLKEDISEPPAKPPHPYQEAMDFISEKLAAVAAADGVEARIPIVRELFEGLLGFQTFLTAYPKMRAAVENKMAELRADERAAELLPLFDRVAEMLRTLAPPS